MLVRGVRLREPGIDLVGIQDVGLSGADDPSVLEWAAEYQRVLLTHDVATVTAFAYERVQVFVPMIVRTQDPFRADQLQDGDRYGLTGSHPHCERQPPRCCNHND